MSQQLAGVGTGFGATARRDNWWIGPIATGAGFGIFSLYATFRVFHNAFYVVDTETSAHILSPFYSPLLVVPSFFPTWVSPAIFILWAPLGFRLTCYYYRKFYYRAYFLDPPACAVGEPRGERYQGETSLFLFQNLHRYMMYLAVIIIFILSYDAVLACVWPDGNGGHKFGMSVGTIVLALNAFMLGCYTFGCHSLRHLVGGKLNCFDCDNFVGNVRFKAWKGVSALNEHHMFWAWVSMVGVGFADFYVWMIASGRITDYILF